MATTERFKYNNSTNNKKMAKDNLKFAFSYALDELFKNNLKDEDGKKVQSYEQLFSAVACIANKYVFKNSKIFVSSAPIFMKFLKIYEVYYLIKIFIIENEALHDFIKKHGGFTDDETLKHPLSLIKMKPNVEADISSFDYYNIVGYDELAEFSKEDVNEHERFNQENLGKQIGFSQEDFDKQKDFSQEDSGKQKRFSQEEYDEQEEFNQVDYGKQLGFIQENYDEQSGFIKENSNIKKVHDAQNTVNKSENQDLNKSDQSIKIKDGNISSSLHKMSMF